MPDPSTSHHKTAPLKILPENQVKALAASIADIPRGRFRNRLRGTEAVEEIIQERLRKSCLSIAEGHVYLIHEGELKFLPIAEGNIYRMSEGILRSAPAKDGQFFYVSGGKVTPADIRPAYSYAPHPGGGLMGYVNDLASVAAEYESPFIRLMLLGERVRVAINEIVATKVSCGPGEAAIIPTLWRETLARAMAEKMRSFVVVKAQEMFDDPADAAFRLFDEEQWTEIISAGSRLGTDEQMWSLFIGQLEWKEKAQEAQRTSARLAEELATSRQNAKEALLARDQRLDAVAAESAERVAAAQAESAGLKAEVNRLRADATRLSEDVATLRKLYQAAQETLTQKTDGAASPPAEDPSRVDGVVLLGGVIPLEQQGPFYDDGRPSSLSVSALHVHDAESAPEEIVVPEVSGDGTPEGGSGEAQAAGALAGDSGEHEEIF